MVKKYLAKKAAHKKARKVYRSLIKKPKRAAVKIAANFIGKSTYLAVKSKRRGRRSRRYR